MHPCKRPDFENAVLQAVDSAAVCGHSCRQFCHSRWHDSSGEG